MQRSPAAQVCSDVSAAVVPSVEEEEEADEGGVELVLSGSAEEVVIEPSAAPLGPAVSVVSRDEADVVPFGVSSVARGLDVKQAVPSVNRAARKVAFAVLMVSLYFDVQQNVVGIAGAARPDEVPPDGVHEASGVAESIRAFAIGPS